MQMPKMPGYLKKKEMQGEEVEKMEYAEGGEEFDHEEHMQKVEGGLNAILNTTEIEEAHQIAESLLNEEKKETKMEKSEYSKEDMDREMMDALK